jgi:hypothetical protein
MQLQQNMTIEEIETCSLCPFGLPAEDPEKPFVGTTLKCIDYETELQALPAGDECDKVNADFSATFDATVYCQCPGVESEAKCNFCPEGQVLTDPTAWISDIYTTCSQMADVALSTTDESFCDSLQRVAEYYCCGDPDEARRLQQHPKTESSVSLKPELRPYHFAAVKALDTIQNTMTKLLENPSSTAIDPYEN